MTATLDEQLIIRRELRDGDVEAIAELHQRVYAPEYGMNAPFVEAVRSVLAAARARGWPERSGAVWLVGPGRLRGSLGLVDEGHGLGRVRWFVFEPELRGRGLGHRLVDELVGAARAQRLERLELETFSKLATAARIYRSFGFELVSEAPRDDWGPPIVYQRYELEL